MPPFYIGHTSLKKFEDGYRGSPTSKKYAAIFRNELHDNPSAFSTRIISEASNRKAAIIRERDIQIKLNVVNNPLYINQSIAHKKYRYGWKWDQQYRSKVIRSLKNIVHTDEWNEKISKSKSGIKRDEKTANMLRSMNKGKKWFNDGINSYLKFPEEANPQWKSGHLNGYKSADKQRGKPKHSEDQKRKWSEKRKGVYWRGI